MNEHTSVGRGAGKRKTYKNKGRALDDAALSEVETLLGTGARSPDLLIEYLHKIQGDIKRM